MRPSLIGLAILVGLAGTGTARAEAAVPGAASPALVLLIAVDQLRRDRLDASLPGGLGRLVRRGRVYEEGALDHAATETCPGHATMLSGRHPGAMGVPANTFIERSTGERVYCVEDPSEDARVFGAGDDPTDGRSPRNLRAGGLGGWMKAVRPQTRVFSVSGKDRSAIAMTGRDAQAAYWISEEEGTGFTTSRYYQAALPSWVVAWNGAFRESLPAGWKHATAAQQYGDIARPDDFPGESDDYSRTSPHPLNAGDREEMAENLWSSPYLDVLTFDFAREWVVRANIGGGASPDLLAISLSATDTVGHAYGPRSAEAKDTLLRLDAGLGDFLDFLEKRLGPDRLLVALTADHGVMPLPEWLGATGAASCPVEGGREGLIGLVAGLLLDLHLELSPLSLPGLWLGVSSQLTVNRDRADDHGISVARVVSVAERLLEEEPVVREAWTEAEIRSGTGPFAALYRNSLDPERSGDIAIQLEPGCLIDWAGTGTSHGTPYGYDREVPILFYGTGVAPGRVSGPAATIDIGPTLAGLLGIPVPQDLDGVDLRAGVPPAPRD